MSARVRIRLRITGLVQGVGFRWFVREQARRLGVAGWVRNEADGAVAVEMEGAEDDVAQLRSLVERGPDAARVDGVQELPPATDPLEKPFAVVRPQP